MSQHIAHEVDSTALPGGAQHLADGSLDALMGVRDHAMAREDQRCRLLMTVPGVGNVTATAFAAAVEDPANFKNSRSVGAWVGLPPRRY